MSTPQKGEVCFYKDEQGLPYLDLEESGEAVAIMLMEQGEEILAEHDRMAEAGVSFVQTVQGNYDGVTKREVLKAKEVRRAQAMLGNPSK